MRTSARAGEAKRAFVATAWRSSGRLSARARTPPGSSTRSASATWHSRIPRVIRIAGDKSRSIARCQARRTMEANRMPGLRRALARALVALVVIETAWLLYPAVRVRLLALEETPARRGQRLAGELGCFPCPGPGGGAGGVGNPGSFKGYVPGFWGADFDDLVRSDEELRTWIAKGELARVAQHPIGGRFFKRQAIKMPAYAHFVPEADVDALAAYVRWIRAGSWRPFIR